MHCNQERKSAYDIAYNACGLTEVEVRVGGEPIGCYAHTKDCDNGSITEEDIAKLKSAFNEWISTFETYIESK